MKRLIPVLFIALVGTAAAQDPVRIIVPQEGAPLEIEFYRPEYTEDTAGGIIHELRYKNITDRKIAALRIGLISFSIFNQHLDSMSGIDLMDLKPGKGRKTRCVAQAPSDFSFLTGIAYVKTVRFMDGEIWEADMDVVLEHIRAIEENFDTSKLSGDEQLLRLSL